MLMSYKRNYTWHKISMYWLPLSFTLSSGSTSHIKLSPTRLLNMMTFSILHTWTKLQMWSQMQTCTCLLMELLGIGKHLHGTWALQSPHIASSNTKHLILEMFQSFLKYSFIVVEWHQKLVPEMHHFSTFHHPFLLISCLKRKFSYFEMSGKCLKDFISGDMFTHTSSLGTLDISANFHQYFFSPEMVPAHGAYITSLTFQLQLLLAQNI